MRNVLIIIGLLLLLGVAFFFTQNYVASNPGGLLGLNRGAKAVIGEHTFNLIVAKTESDKQVGLSDRKSLPKNTGMLFPYDSESYPVFWMKDMEFPIDILFIRDSKIVTIYKNIQPPNTSENIKLYQPEEPSDNVLEINAGLSDEYGIKKGDSVTITL
jgi:uncharacterized protein